MRLYQTNRPKGWFAENQTISDVAPIYIAVTFEPIIRFYNQFTFGIYRWVWYRLLLNFTQLYFIDSSQQKTTQLNNTVTTQHNSTRFNSTQLNSTQLNLTQRSTTQLISTHWYFIINSNHAQWMTLEMTHWVTLWHWPNDPNRGAGNWVNARLFPSILKTLK